MSLVVFSPRVALQIRAFVQDFQGDVPLLARKGLQVAAVLVVAILARRLVQALSRRIIRMVDDGDPATFTAREQRGHTIAQLLTSVGTATIMVISGVAILGFFVPIGPFLASIGVVGLAISFGAQSLVKDVISGFFVLVENQFSVGDIIEISGVSGVVERMTLRVVMIRDANGVLHVIPNGSIPMVSNKTRHWARSVVDVPVAYSEDLDRVIGVLRQLATELWKDERWKLDLTEEPAVQGVEAMSDVAMTVRLVATTRPGRQWDVARELRRRVKNRFDKEHIVMPSPRTLHLGDPRGLRQILAPPGGETPAAES